MTDAQVPVDLLRELLALDEATGLLTWRRRHRRLFMSDATCKSWNARMALKSAFTATGADGYLKGSIFNRLLLAHRVVFALTNGRWPAGQVDHLNGVRTDNRPANLREASNAVNGRNQKRSSRNTSGVTGVYFDRRRARYVAHLCSDGRRVFLGSFESLREAAAARAKANHQHGFHRNHGRTS